MQHLDVNSSRDDVARTTYHWALIPFFNKTMEATVVIINYTVFAAFYIADAKLGLAAAFVQAIHYKFANGPKQLDRRINGQRRAFIDRNFGIMRAQWPHPTRQMYAAMAIHKAPSQINFETRELPPGLKGALTLAAIETGIRCTVLQPFYAVGKATWRHRYNFYAPVFF
jgi:hypothetical protein